MIVANSWGVYMPGLRPPETFDPERDPRVLQVRTRRAKDLTNLRRHFLPELGKTIKLRGTDYEYRAYCTREQWGQALARMAEAIDYVKFKDTARDEDLHRLYLSMWGTILNHLSPRPTWWDTQPRNARKKGKRGRRQEPEWANYLPETGSSSLWTDEDWARALDEIGRSA